MKRFYFAMETAKTEIMAAVAILFMIILSGPAWGAGPIETTCSTSRGTLEARLFAPGEDVVLSSRAVVHIYDHFGNTIDRIDKKIEQMFLQAHEKATLIYRDATPNMASCELELRDRIVEPTTPPHRTAYVYREPPTSSVSYEYVHHLPSSQVVIHRSIPRHQTHRVIIHERPRHHRTKHIIVNDHNHRTNRVIIKRNNPSWQGHIRVNL